jgi:hypothetical protein
MVSVRAGQWEEWEDGRSKYGPTFELSPHALSLDVLESTFYKSPV